MDGTQEGRDAEARFESIIDFHTPAACAEGLLPCRKVSMDGAEELGSLLDDKLLLNDFNEVIFYGRMGGKRIKDNKGKFARRFIMFLLRSRFLFDKFIIKREHIEGDRGGELES